jgi:hypothetical protein
MNTLPEALPARGWRHRESSATWQRIRHPLAIYAASRLLYLVLALVDAAVQNANLGRVFRNWDGKWYVLTAQHWYWYPNFSLHSTTLAQHYTTLGFLPLFPMLEWLLSHITQLPLIYSGLTLSLVTGAVATVLVIELARQWWGEAAARRALLFWCFFPGTVVFSMVYTEGLLISLIAGSLLLLRGRRWASAGLLAGLATAVAPVALAVIPACAVAAGLEIRHRGWADREARRALLAPILSPVGVVAFGIFLWFLTGTPLASFHAQHGAWQETTTPLAVPRLFGSLIHQIFISGVGHRHGPGGIDLNGILGILGAAFLLYGLWRLWKVRQTIPIPVWVWTIFAALLALTSAKTPPNPRLLICMFPVVLIVGSQHRGRAQRWLLAADIACLLVMSWFTYVGIWLRP